MLPGTHDTPVFGNMPLGESAFCVQLTVWSDARIDNNANRLGARRIPKTSTGRAIKCSATSGLSDSRERQDSNGQPRTTSRPAIEMARPPTSQKLVAIDHIRARASANQDAQSAVCSPNRDFD
jgi:hypothetical protein